MKRKRTKRQNPCKPKTSDQPFSDWEKKRITHALKGLAASYQLGCRQMSEWRSGRLQREIERNLARTERDRVETLKWAYERGKRLQAAKNVLLGDSTKEGAAEV